VNSKRRSRHVLQSRFEVIAERTIRLPRIRKPSRLFFPLKCRGSPSRASPPVANSTLPASASLLRHGSNRRLSLARATPGLCRPCRDLSLSLPKVVLRDDSARNRKNIMELRTRRSRHFNVLVLAVVGARIGTCIDAPLWRGCHALISALQGERAAVALRGNVTCGPRGSPPPPSSSPPFGRRGRWWWWRGRRGCRGGRFSYAPGRDDGV
jgi:hypothetical protein